MALVTRFSLIFTALSHIPPWPEWIECLHDGLVLAYHFVDPLLQKFWCNFFRRAHRQICWDIRRRSCCRCCIQHLRHRKRRYGQSRPLLWHQVHGGSHQVLIVHSDRTNEITLWTNKNWLGLGKTHRWVID
jgi:hypothetical protein